MKWGQVKVETEYDNKSAEFLSFKAGDQEYSIEIEKVKEIRGATKITPMPLTPSFVKGVINLRGTVLPVMSLSERLGLAPIKNCDRSVIIVISDSHKLTGLIVDSVSNIISINLNDLKILPHDILRLEDSLVKLVTCVDEKFVRVLDISEVVNYN